MKERVKKIIRCVESEFGGSIEDGECSPLLLIQTEAQKLLILQALDAIFKFKPDLKKYKEQKFSPAFSAEMKLTMGVSYDKLREVMEMVEEATGIEHPCTQTIQNAVKTLKENSIVVNGVPGDGEGTAGAQVSVKELLAKIVSIPIVKEKLQIFDDDKTLLVRITIDNARETAQRCMEITSLNLLNLLDHTGLHCIRLFGSFH